ncbi:MAG: sulfotransferase [Pseudoxanthomonas sp.]
MSIDRKLQEIAALQQRGSWDQAERVLTALLGKFPADASIHRAMALHASRSGREALALAHMTKASELAPESVEFGFQLGCLQAHAGQNVLAAKQFRSIIRRSPEFADAWYFLGITLSRQQQDGDARVALRTAHRLAPTQARILKALADVEFRIGYPVDALPLWEQLERIQPDDVDTRLKTGETLSRLGFHEQARAAYERALHELRPSGDLWMALAQAEEDNGDRQAAQHAYESALALKPAWAFPLSGLLGLHRGKAPDALIEQATLLQASDSLPDADRALIGYEMGKVHDGRGEYEEAMSSWHDANAARRRMIGKPDLERFELNAARTIEIFRPEFFSRAETGSPDPRFVFIVGMPRSGTTLTEQIIASHPQAFGCGELPDIALIARNLPVQLQSPLGWPDAITAMTTEVLEQSVRRYVEAATRHAPVETLRLVDKAPLNFFNLGLIAVMFPNARVIWCRRDPRDVAVSIYGENFSLEERLATDLQDIGHYINLQNRLMRHWQSALPLPILELNYETLVTNLEGKARELIDFIGLPWDPACLDFHRSDRGVQTPSRWQVKQPAHTRSIGRWRNYESALGPLLKVLDQDQDEDHLRRIASQE